MSEKEYTRSEKIEYIAAAIRYTTQESGLKDFSGFIILASEYELNMSDELLGFPVYVVSGFLQNSFILSYRYDCDSVRFKAMKVFIEFQELYNIGDEYG